ncbi:MAG: 3-deoxy-7-phosphoheptulonate synthase [Candidatus Omnitrophica bacterium]|nr:3-deoxy-7-phosphoheptulonate synthase [Candidatus Omnitrophota bacterium]
MGFEYLQKIPTADEIINDMPLPADLAEIKLKRDLEIKDVFTGNNSKFILIIGPCSADDENSVCEYINRLSKLQETVKDKIVIIPRVYTNKPRTTGEGYKGMLHQPDPNEAPNIVEGIKALRKMHLRVLKESRLTVADEMLYPENYPYLEDLLSYVAIGARSVENQQHRLTVSGLTIPVGMKNPTSGDLNVVLNSIQAAQLSHVFLYKNWEVKTRGNELVHGILRGAVNQYGRAIPNYHYEHLSNFIESYLKRDLANPAIIVDVNHANSDKDYAQQPRIAMEVIHSMRSSQTISETVKGLMIESYLIEGRADIGKNKYGQSITDACLGWEDSEKLVLKIADRL